MGKGKKHKNKPRPDESIFSVPHEERVIWVPRVSYEHVHRMVEMAMPGRAFLIPKPSDAVPPNARPTAAIVQIDENRVHQLYLLLDRQSPEGPEVTTALGTNDVMS